MGKHSLSARKAQDTRYTRIRQSALTVAKHAKHPIAHLSTAIALHVIALAIIEKSPILFILGIH